jgi:hypothetical protein
VTRVEYRFFQLILSPLAGDRVTVALVHWDGRELRTKSSPRAAAICKPQHRTAIRDTIAAFSRQANRTARAQQPASEALLSLAHVFPVREGLGAALAWSPVHTAETRNPEAHFTELVEHLGLDQQDTHAERTTTASVREWLVCLLPACVARWLIDHVRLPWNTAPWVFGRAIGRVPKECPMVPEKDRPAGM